MKKIVIDKVTDKFYFNKKKDIVLGPWCFKDYLKIEEIIQNKFEFNFIEDQVDQIKAFKCCEEQHKRIINKLAKHLKIKNKVNFSLSFFKNYVSYWLLDFIHLTHFAKRLSNLYKNKFGKEKFEILINYKILDNKFTDTQDYLSKTYRNTNFFSHFVLSFLLNSKPKKWEVKKLYNTYNVKVLKKKGFFYTIKKFIYNWFISRVNNVYGFNIFEKFFLSLLLTFKKIKIKYNKYNTFYTLIKPSKLKSPLNDDELFELILKYIPQSFYKIKNKKNFFLNCTNKVMLCSSSSLVDDDKKFNPLLFKELGGRIISVQHGSAYGDASVSLHHGHEYLFDKFISWGQKNHQNYKVKFLPLPSPQLRKKVEFNDIKDNKKILFVSTSNMFVFPKYLKMRSFKESCNRVKNTYFFLKNLKKTPYHNIYYKDSPFGHFSEKKLFKNKFKKINFITKIPENYISKVKLVVMNNHSTFFFKSLSMNVPTILFYEKNSWDSTKKAKKLFDILHEAEIIHYNPKKAAKKLNNDIFDWWYSKKTQTARKLFCDEFALSSRNTFKIWLKFFLT